MNEEGDTMVNVREFTNVEELILKSGNIAKIAIHPDGGINILFERSSMTNGDTRWLGEGQKWDKRKEGEND